MGTEESSERQRETKGGGMITADEKCQSHQATGLGFFEDLSCSLTVLPLGTAPSGMVLNKRGGQGAEGGARTENKARSKFFLERDPVHLIYPST